MVKLKQLLLFVAVACALCLPGYAEKQALVIAGDVYPEQILSRYMSENPDIGIEFSERDRLETLVEDAISHADNVDMYFLYVPNSTVFQQMRDRGYLAGIQDGTLLDYAAGLYPSILDAVCKDDVLYAVPYEQLIFPTIGVDMDVWEELGFGEQDLPHTWSDFYRFVLNDWPAIAQAHEEMALFNGIRDAASLLQRIERNFEACRAVHDYRFGYDIPELREALGLLQQIDPSVFSEQKFRSVFAGMYQPSVLDDYANVRYLPLSITGDEAVLATGLYVMAANPNSPNLERCMEVMRYVVDKAEDYAAEELCPNDNEPILAEYYEEEKSKYDEEMLRYERLIEDLTDENLKKEIVEERDGYDAAMQTFFEVYAYAASSASIQQYREEVNGRLVPVYGTYLNDDEYRALNEKRQQLLEGIIDVNQYIDELERRFVMNTLEG